VVGCVVGGNVLMIDVEVVVGGRDFVVDVVNFELVVLVFVVGSSVGNVGRFVGKENGSPIVPDLVMMICGTHCASVRSRAAARRREWRYMVCEKNGMIDRSNSQKMAGKI
jgi:hypothetical protein